MAFSCPPSFKAQRPGAAPLILLLLLALLCALPPSEAPAQAGGPYRLRKQALLSGAHADGGSLTLEATVGEGIAAVQQGGSYRLTGGFHSPRRADALFADGFE